MVRNTIRCDGHGHLIGQTVAAVPDRRVSRRRIRVRKQDLAVVAIRGFNARGIEISVPKSLGALGAGEELTRKPS